MSATALAPSQLTPDQAAPDHLASMIKDIAEGDATAFDQLYTETSARIYGLVLRVLRCPDQAAEVTQEVYLQVWRTADRFDPERSRSTVWLSMLAHRRAVDRVRSVQAARVRDGVFAERCDRAYDEVWEDVVIRSEAAHIRTALLGLSTVQRESLVLTYFGGHTAGTVAAMLQVPVGTVKTRIRDGLINLRRNLAPA